MIYVIGSVSQEEDIKKVADYFRNYFKDKGGFTVEYVKKEPEKSLVTLILECFNKIQESDTVVAVKKPDGSYGTGTTYEICFAKFIGKEVIEISVNDIEELESKWNKNKK